jgi:TPR repeat protein/mono/diheme cytochrome c family protein
MVMGKASRILSAAGVLLFAAFAGAATPTEVAGQVKGILKANCYRCHGERGAAEGGMAYVTDLGKLVERKKVVPGNAAGSKLFKKMASEDDPMPPLTDDDNKPISQRPSKAEIALVKQWIEAGAVDEAPAVVAVARVFVSDADMLLAMQKDLNAAEERSRTFIRYFTITHLYNAGLNDDELETYRGGLSKLVNSLSWGRRVVVPVAVDAPKTVFRIDLRDYKWNEETWKKIIGADPYRFEHADAVAMNVAAMTQCELPYARADWFVFAASRPPLYHEVLELPATDSELEKLLKVDVAEDIRTERIARAGFNGSGVSRSNRLIERHDSPYGAYWKSYDFKKGGQNERKNLFAHPLGPGEDAKFFEQDGGEIIFNLPNGLQVNGKGARIDKGPLEVVSDPKQEDRAVVNGVSCMSCHAKGMIEKSDQMRDTVVGNAAGYDAGTIDLVKALYPVKANFDALLKDDADRFMAAAEKTGAAKTKAEPVVTLSLRFETDVDLSLAAAEAGMTQENFRDVLAHSPFLAPRIGALMIAGGTVQRDVFAESFIEIGRLRTLWNFSHTRREIDNLKLLGPGLAAAKGDPEGMYNYAIQLQCGIVPTDLPKALTLLTDAANKGNVPAMLRLADMYGRDLTRMHPHIKSGTSFLGVQKDQIQAVAWYKRAADAGSAFGMLQLGVCYENGEGVEKDADQAAALYAKAFRTASVNAETDAASAMCLGLIYDEGKGVARDAAQKYAFHLKAADRGEPFSLMLLADAGAFGIGQHAERETEAFATAADAGNLDAMHMLGLSLILVNPADGRARLEKVAAAGVADAMMELAQIYSKGEGVPKDENLATIWINKAAIAGDYDAMIKLAERCEAGFAVIKDHAVAVGWMRAAAALETGDSPGTAKRWLTDHGENP